MKLLKNNSLISFLSKKNRKKQPHASKNKGSVLLISIILSGMILSIGAMAAKILIKEIEFTSDLLFAEKSYFSAESGVELALLELKKEPVRNVMDQEVLLANGTISKLTIENRNSEFKINIPQNGNTKFRLMRQTNENDPLGTTIINTQKVQNFAIKNSDSKKFHWKILCKKGLKTVAIQNDFETLNFNSMTALGTMEDEHGIVSKNESLHNFLQNIDHQKCFLSLENLADSGEIELVLGAPQKIAPDKSKVTAIGKAGNREKRIVFDYAQKNLGSLFDFVFFHSDDGI